MPIEEFWVLEKAAIGISSLGSKDLAVDVGANRGTWAEYLSSAFARVVAIEPDARASSFIGRLGNVSLIEAVAASSCGEMYLHLRENPDQNSLLEDHPIGGPSCSSVPPIAKQKVASVTLDSICEGGADFVKIDVEGAEADVLKGCSADGRWSRTLFVVECHDTKDAVSGELNRLGKEIDWVPHVYSAHPGHCWAIARGQAS